jgi:hypothetical protein
MTTANTDTNTTSTLELNERNINEGEHQDEWDDLIVAPDNYQINRRTLVIRNKHTGRSPIINTCKQTGYSQLSIDSVTRPLHRVLALQYVPNSDPDRFTVVDHIDRNKKNNALNNLRWVEPEFNSKNRLSHARQMYEWVDMLPEDLVQIQRYRCYNFDNLFYSQANFYVQVGSQYRKLKVVTYHTHSGVNVQDDQGRKVRINLDVIRRNYNLRA